MLQVYSFIGIGLIFLIMWLTTKPKVVSLKKYYKSMLAQGGVNALFGIFSVYGSPITRTPPVLYCIICNLSIFFGMFLTHFIVKEKKHVNYCKLYPILGMIAIVVSTCLIMTAKIVTDLNNQHFTYWTFFWSFIILAGIFFGSIYNILQEQYLKESNKELPKKIDQIVNYFYVLFTTSLVQFVIMAFCWWVDIIPVYGFSTYDTFWNHLGKAFYCFFGGSGYVNPLFGVLFTIGYLLTYLAEAIMNEDSGNFALYVQSAETPIVSLIFMIVGLGTESTPLWAVIPSVTICTFGIVVWKTGEFYAEKQNSKPMKPKEQEMNQLISPA